MTWVNPAEYLPEQDTPVLVWAEEFGLGGGMAVARLFISTEQPNDPKWYLDDDFYRLDSKIELAQAVIAWQPMPVVPPWAMFTKG